MVTDAVKIPVVAAGGIMDGRGMAAMFMLGACGIQMGTRFLVTTECPIPGECKEALLKAQVKDSLVLGDRVGAVARLRVLKTNSTEEILASEPASTLADFEKAVSDTRILAYSGGLSKTLIGTGQGIGLATKLTSVEEVILEISTDCRVKL